jgi:hypothetical protein
VGVNGLTPRENRTERRRHLRSLGQAQSVEEKGGARERRVPPRSRPDVRQNGEENQRRQERPPVRRPLREAHRHGDDRRNEDGKEQGMVQPAERLGVHEADLHEQTQHEVRQEKDCSQIEYRCRHGPDFTAARVYSRGAPRRGRE